MPLLVIVGVGVILMQKKEIEWIQPPTQRGGAAKAPSESFEALFAAAMTADEAISELNVTLSWAPRGLSHAAEAGERTSGLGHRPVR